MMYSSDGSREKAVEKLIHGHGCANQLKQWLHSSSIATDGSSVPIEELSNAIFDSFSDALSIVGSINFTTTDQIMPAAYSTLSGESIAPSIQHQSRFSNTRKTDEEARAESWRDDSPTPIYHDGYIWRKYGQKQIKRSKHQRSYYRCTYNDVCKAKKYVQKIQDHPPVYRTTYFGLHTCHHHHPNLPILSEATAADDESRTGTIIRFDKKDQDQDQDSRPLFPTTLSEVNHQEMYINQDQKQGMMMTMMEKESWASDYCYYTPSPCTMMFDQSHGLQDFGSTVFDNAFHQIF